MKNIIIEEKDKKVLSAVLTQTLPEGIKVFVFGFRVKGTSKQYADLDLALEARDIIEQQIIDNLNIALENSLLPFKVDVIDLKNIDIDFYNAISKDLTPFK